jgi:hypothetical protein
MSEVNFEPLPIDQIDFRVQSINKGGYATILAYKNARVDMNILNDAFGPGYWQRKHELINGQLFCSVGIWNKEISQWCWVQDVGTQSNTEKEKGQASDSFKRACFNLGIGIELYDYPMISIKLHSNEVDLNAQPRPKQTWGLKLKEWKWHREFTDGKISCLAAKDEKGGMRFKWGQFKKDTAK